MHQRSNQRPWPRPARPWLLAMRWHDLLFLHWPLDPAALRPFLPPALELQTFDGAAWLGVVPFRMSSVRPRATPPLPWLSAFPELNLRTYVSFGGKPGVWFFSLDAANPLAVEAARLGYHLPYQHARMRCERHGEAVAYASERRPGAAPAAFVARYYPTGPAYHAGAGSLESWLTERYCLYAADRRGRLWRGEIDHRPWPLQPATVDIAANSMAAPLGLAFNGAPLLHFSRRLDVVAWSLDRLV